VAKVGVHRAQRDRLAASVPPTIDDGTRQAQLSAAVEAANRQFARKSLHNVAGAVRRVVVHHDDLAIKAVRVKDGDQRAEQLFDAVGLVVGWNHDREGD
jgi:hypothetical protein